MLTNDAKMQQSESVNEALKDHLTAITNGASWRAMATQAGLEPSTLKRQLDGEPKVQTVVAICRAYGRPILPALVAAGFITEEEAFGMAVGAQLKLATEQQLVEEMLSRVVAAKEAGTEGSLPELFEPVDQAAVEAATKKPADGSNVVGKTEDELQSEYRLAANRDNSHEKLDPDGL